MQLKPKSICGDPVIREKIKNLEAVMLTLPQVEIPVEHVICNGIAARKIVIKAGVTLTGAIHLTEHLNVVNGDITVVTEEGEKRLIGMNMFVSKPGTKRAGSTHAETTWICFNATDLTDPDLIEAAITTTDCNDPRLLALQELLKLKG